MNQKKKKLSFLERLQEIKTQIRTVEREKEKLEGMFPQAQRGLKLIEVKLKLIMEGVVEEVFTLKGDRLNIYSEITEEGKIETKAYYSAYLDHHKEKYAEMCSSLKEIFKQRAVKATDIPVDYFETVFSYGDR